MIVLQTERLRHMSDDGAGFMLALLNDPAYHRYIGERQVHSVDATRDYMRSGAMAMVARLGFGLYIVERQQDGCLIGVAGRAKRDFLDDVDIGYAFLPQYGGQGDALKAAQDVLAHAREPGLTRLVATVRPDNGASIRLLEKLGLRFETTLQAPDTARELQLFGRDLRQGAQ